MKHRARQQPRPLPPVDNPFPTTDEIAARAHELFVAGGRQIRRISDHWRQAEHDLLDKAARRFTDTRR